MNTWEENYNIAIESGATIEEAEDFANSCDFIDIE